MNTMDAFRRVWLPRIEAEMREWFQQEPAPLRPLYRMMRYHLGWEDLEGRSLDAAKGKRLRPLLTLMTAQAAGADPARALPAAAGVELIHNFSLIHDDIEDRSPTRRHRPTLWSLLGEAQAINAGDAMFAIAHLALLRLRQTGLPPESVLDAMHIFDDTCLRLTEGQFLDMDFETRLDVDLEDYLFMIAGKTAALIATAAELGAIVAQSPYRHAYRTFGHELGISFQIEDDILGIWGEEALTGKSATGDILTRKKTLPVLYALAQPGPAGDQLRAYYAREAPLTPADLPPILELLAELGARDYAREQGRLHAQAALDALVSTQGDPQTLEMLSVLVKALIERAS